MLSGAWLYVREESHDSELGLIVAARGLRHSERGQQHSGPDPGAALLFAQAEMHRPSAGQGRLFPHPRMAESLWGFSSPTRCWFPGEPAAEVPGQAKTSPRLHWWHVYHAH